MRHAATFALLSRRDVIIVASVSCIYGIGSRDTYEAMTVELEVGADADRDAVLRRLVELQYERNDIDFHRGTFRVRGDTVEVFPAYEADTAVRIEWWGDKIEAMSEIDPLRGKAKRTLDRVTVFPASPLRDSRGHDASRGAEHSHGAEGPARAALAAGQAPRAPAPRAAHDVRPRIDRADGLLFGHRELLAPPHAAHGRRAAADADGLLR
jgi:transcription-repair coupling factor (superfamily II helicase)